MHTGLNFRRLLPAVLLASAASLTGCGAPEAEFHLDRVFVHKTLDEPESREEARNLNRQLQNLKDVMVGLFGTPNEPHVPQLAEADATTVLNPGLVYMAAGPVGRDEHGRARGLYREHCAHCHGVNGDGAGPTAAYLNPYPRDFRMGKFKFKSTPLGVKPTHDDLRKTVINGIPDTAMPSFRLLADDQIDALVDYVKYLAIRGEVERRLVAEALTEIDPDQLLLDPAAKESELFQENLEIVKGTVSTVVSQWEGAAAQITEIPAPPENWLSAESVRHGRDLFFGTQANCIKCHGNLALGDGETGDYDDWVKEIDEKNPGEHTGPFLALGIREPRLLDPRPIIPRNLRAGVFRGGHRPVDIFLRVKNGIEGTPMPAAPSQGLSSDDLWSIVAYVRSLPQEPISKPEGYQVDLARERL
jgi:mono/diheme cytochrome c family protein